VKLAPKNEKGIYQKYAQHLQRHLWWSAENAGGDEMKFRVSIM